MKKIYISIAFILIAQIAMSQTLGYNDVGVLFAKEQINGTARYNALSGAFGALGGDLSAISINPAGASVFSVSELSATIGMKNDIIDASYYNNQVNSENDYAAFTQAGGVFVFRSLYKKKGWNKMALSFNYDQVANFESSWIAEGNSNNPTFVKKPGENKITHPLSHGQSFESLQHGANKKYTFGFSTKYNDDLYLGASINTHDINFGNTTLLVENNYNTSNSTLDAKFKQELAITGNAVSLGVGVIGKPIKNLRLGLAYQSPTWYNISEEFMKEDSTVDIDKGAFKNDANSGVNAYEYKLKTPAKLTGSFAYVFGKNGLISMDYTHKNYSGIKYQSGNFINENKFFSKELKSTSNVRVGTEWVVNKFSFRGGYHYESSPYKEAKASDDISGFSLGTGYKFKGGRIDIAYQRNSYSSPYDFYPEYNELKSAELNTTNNIFTATLLLRL